MSVYLYLVLGRFVYLYLVLGHVCLFIPCPGACLSMYRLMEGGRLAKIADGPQSYCDFLKIMLRW